jgi:hypothetical protein
VQLVLLVRLVIYVCVFFLDNHVFILINLGDSCATFPCKNGAGCTNLLTATSTNWSAYRCVCPLGFYGQNCETSKKK